MSTEDVESLLIDAGLEEKGVSKVVEEYSQLQTKFQNGEYAAVGTASGRFCEGIVRVLRYEMDNDTHSSLANSLPPAV